MIRFKGKSPSGNDLPRGVRLQPLGNLILFAVVSVWAEAWIARLNINTTIPDLINAI
jgi:hypothetical protein